MIGYLQDTEVTMQLAAFQSVTFPERDETIDTALVVMPITKLSGTVLNAAASTEPISFSNPMVPFCITVHNNLHFGLTEEARLRLLFRDGESV
jgi:hypothetical protein